MDKNYRTIPTNFQLKPNCLPTENNSVPTKGLKKFVVETLIEGLNLPPSLIGIELMLKVRKTATKFRIFKES
jgi:hypothetical protein